MAKGQERYPSQTLVCPYNILGAYKDIYHEGPGTELPIHRSFPFINEKGKFDENIESVIVNRELSVHITSKLLMNDCVLEELNPTVLKKLKRIEQSYKNVMEEFSTKLSKWLRMRRDTILELQKSEQRFRLIHRTTTGITFISSAVEFVARAGLILKNVLHLKMDLPLIIPVLSGISITSSILALSYSRAILADIARELREDRRRQKDLERLYQKGEWVDRAVQDLFPFGIDINLLKDPALQKQSWRHHLCSIIILTNIKKDKKLLDDRDFLPTVKAFVESPAAQIWVNRMKLRELLDTMSCKCENLSEKGVEVFLNRAAINLYPVFLPLLVRTRNTEKIRFLFSSVATVVTALDLTDSRPDEFQEMRDTVLALRNEYVKIRKMNNSLISDYD